MIEIATLILGIIKVIPSLERIFLKVSDLYFYQLQVADQNSSNKNAHKRDALLSSLQQKGLTDEQRDTIRRMLFDISRN